MRQSSDPYQVLGVPRDADADTIKTAFRRQAMQYHPDRNPGDRAAEEKFKELSEAYALLRDPAQRQRYDRYGSQPEPGYVRPEAGGVDWRTVFTEADIPIDWSRHAGAPTTGNAVFDMLFGMVTGFMRRSGMLPGETREVTLPLTLGEALAGASKRLDVPGPSVCATCGGSGRAEAGPAVATSPRPFEAPVRTAASGACPSCGGQGVRRGTSAVDVTVPPRSSSGGRLRLRGLGGPGNPPGDLIARLVVRLPASATVVGGEVRDRLDLTPWAASSGATVDYEGVSVKVAAGTANGRSLRVAGAGIGGKDLVLTANVDVVSGLIRPARAWLRKLFTGGASV